MSVITDDSIRNLLRKGLGESEKDVITYPFYASAAEGVSSDHRVIYDFFKMTVKYSTTYNVDLDEATQCVINDVSKLEKAAEALGKKSPIIKFKSFI